MKKLLSLIFLTLLLCNTSYAQNLKPLSEFIEENQDYNTDPTVFAAVVSRCASYYLSLASIIYEQEQKLSDGYHDLGLDLKMFAIRILVTKGGEVFFDASKAIDENINRMTDSYMRTAKDNYAKRGSHFKGSPFEGDSVICDTLQKNLLF